MNILSDLTYVRESASATRQEVRNVRSAYWRARTLAVRRPARAMAFLEAARRLKEYADRLEYVEFEILGLDDVAAAS